MKRALGFVVPCLALLVWAAPAHAADPVFEAAIEPDRIVFGETRPVAALTVATGADAERFEVTVIPVSGGYPGLDGSTGGSLLHAGCEVPAAEGPATASRASCVTGSGFPPCGKTGLPSGHGVFGGKPSFGVEAPPNSRTTFRLPLDHAPTAPWPQSRYRVEFFMRGETLEGGAARTGTPGYAPAGRTGVRLALQASAPSRPTADCKPFEDTTPENRGELITLTGRADPYLAGEEVILRYATEAAPAPRELARLRVAGDGTFVLRNWSPPEPGYYEVAAAYVSQHPSRTDDLSEPLSFRFTAPSPKGRLPPVDQSRPPGPIVDQIRTPIPVAPMLVNRSLRVARDRLVRLRLYCPAGRREPCSGAIRLRIGGRTVASRTGVV
ncbi:MAG: hypothetical protein M3P50_12665, partial [Actinomycetota bacterium]|nr:hypothetical protein [Actinomycetota bacterium]